MKKALFVITLLLTVGAMAKMPAYFADTDERLHRVLFLLSYTEMKRTTSIQLSVGPYGISTLKSPIIPKDGGTVFGSVKQKRWSELLVTDEKSQIPWISRPLLLKSAQARILIDTGYGTHLEEKYGKEKALEITGDLTVMDHLTASLVDHQLVPDDITHVILTHGHLAHCGGATFLNMEGYQPTFKNATYYLQSENLNVCKKPHPLEAGNYEMVNLACLHEQGQLALVKGNQENLLPHISVFSSHGHTGGLQVVKISAGNETLLCCSDVIPTAHHVPLTWTSPDDLDPKELFYEKAQILERAASEEWFLYFSHDVNIEGATIAAIKGNYAIKEAFRFI